MRTKFKVDKKKLKEEFDSLIVRIRYKLAQTEAVPSIALLSILTGLVTTTIVLLFRLCIELPLQELLPGGNHENFEDLSHEQKWMFIGLGLFCTYLLLSRIKPSLKPVGVAHVMERLMRHQGHLPLGNAITQFIGGALAAVSGLSVGREGPAVHLGAASSSLIGQKLKLPNNTIRTLVGCGTAAAIAASFNTPMAGVIFALEVVILDYSLTSFIPVIVSSVCGATMARLFFGDQPAFNIPDVLELKLETHLELPAIVILGLCCGIASAILIKSIRLCLTFKSYSLPLRLSFIGILTGMTAIYLPQVMGIGYDTVNAIITGDMTWQIVGALIFFKLLLTAITIGLGIPGGIIGPSFFIGACIGFCIGQCMHAIAPQSAEVSQLGFYAMVGMTATMGSLLQAPLAALMAMLEMTHNPNILLPAMLAIVIASMTVSSIFKCDSIFHTTLKEQGLEYTSGAISQMLSRVAAISLMDRSICRVKPSMTLDAARAILVNKPKWIIIDEDRHQARKLLMPAVDLAREVELIQSEGDKHDDDEKNHLISLLDIPAQRLEVLPILDQASLKEALDLTESKNLQAVYVHRQTAPGIFPIMGVLTKQSIENYYKVH